MFLHMLLAVVVVIMILKVISVVILLKVFIAFCNIRGGGRGGGGVILYEKKIATAKERSTRHRRQLSGRFGDIL